MALTKEKINECAMEVVESVVQERLSFVEDDEGIDIYQKYSMYAWTGFAYLEGVIALKDKMIDEMERATEEDYRLLEERCKKC